MLVQLLTAIAPVLVAVVTIIPTVIANRKKTEESISAAGKATDERVAKIQTTLDAHIRENEDDAARNRRYRILRFYDELCLGMKHSESHFEDILDDIDNYERYCAAHKDFVNNRGECAMHKIKEVYAQIKEKGGFLAHDDGSGDDAA